MARKNGARCGHGLLLVDLEILFNWGVVTQRMLSLEVFTKKG
jgi:hypothetical protein